MKRTWTKLTVTCKTADLDRVCSVMSMLDNGLMIEDYSDFSLNGMYGELVDDSILHADKNVARVSLFVPEEKNFAEYRTFLDARFSALGLDVKTDIEGLREEAWAESWKKYYHPIPLGRVTVVPAWMEYEEKPGEIVIRMDPGMAFGTGTHETTRLCLRLLEDAVRPGDRVLDIGTGSGILSIAAAKLGASACRGYDIDPVAVRVARDNVAESSLSDKIEIGVSDLLCGVDRSAPYSLCVANIVADIILRLLPDLPALLRPGAPLILSGIIAERAGDVRNSAEKNGFVFVRELTENDWVALEFQRR